MLSGPSRPSGRLPLSSSSRRLIVGNRDRAAHTGLRSVGGVCGGVNAATVYSPRPQVPVVQLHAHHLQYHIEDENQELQNMYIC